MERDGEVKTYWMLTKNHEVDKYRVYEIIHSKEEWSIKLEIPKKLLVEDVIRSLNLFIDDLQRHGFKTPLVAIEGQPMMKEADEGFYLFFDTANLKLSREP